MGATRLYIADDDWQAYVAQLMRKASLVVMVVDETEALLWELEHALKTVPADRILLFVQLYSKGRLRSAYQELEAIDAVLQRIRSTGLPHHSEDSVPVWFGRDGRAFVESAPTSVEIFDRVKAALNRLPDDRRHLHSRLTKPGFRWRYGLFGSILGSLCLFTAFAGVRAWLQLAH